MNEDDHDPSNDPNPCWDSVDPECRWVPQCRRMHIPGACERCESLNPNPDLPRDEVGESCSSLGDPEYRIP